jgi:hypothetical protein
MEEKTIFNYNDRNSSLDCDNNSVNMQVFKDSLENSASIVNSLSLNVNFYINKFIKN